VTLLESPQWTRLANMWERRAIVAATRVAWAVRWLKRLVNFSVRT
jgi:hypothetical protein